MALHAPDGPAAVRPPPRRRGHGHRGGDRAARRARPARRRSPASSTGRGRVRRVPVPGPGRAVRGMARGAVRQRSRASAPTSTSARRSCARTSASTCATCSIPSRATRSCAEERLAQTAVTQPALFVVEYALATAWRAPGVEPDGMIGHCVGEYVAACLAGVFTRDDALRLVAERGRLMQALPAGTMLAVRATRRRRARAPAGRPRDRRRERARPDRRLGRDGTRSSASRRAWPSATSRRAGSRPRTPSTRR